MSFVEVVSGTLGVCGQKACFVGESVLVLFLGAEVWPSRGPWWFSPTSCSFCEQPEVEKSAKAEAAGGVPGWITLHEASSKTWRTDF